jgi:hypothetical protein
MSTYWFSLSSSRGEGTAISNDMARLPTALGFVFVASAWPAANKKTKHKSIVNNLLVKERGLERWAVRRAAVDNKRS